MYLARYLARNSVCMRASRRLLFPSSRSIGRSARAAPRRTNKSTTYSIACAHRPTRTARSIRSTDVPASSRLLGSSDVCAPVHASGQERSIHTHVAACTCTSTSRCAHCFSGFLAFVSVGSRHRKRCAAWRYARPSGRDTTLKKAKKVRTLPGWPCDRAWSLKP